MFPYSSFYEFIVALFVEAGKLISPFLATILATFTGATVAFFWERRLKRKTEEEKLVANANRTLFTLSRQIIVLTRIKKEIIGEYKDHRGAWLLIKPTVANNWDKWRHDINTISFIMDSKEPNMVTALLEEEDRYLEALQCFNERSKMHINRVQPELSKAEVGREPILYNEVLFKRILGEDVVEQMKSYTTNMIEHVYEGIPSAIELVHNLRKLFIEIFPDAKAKLITVKFSEEELEEK